MNIPEVHYTLYQSELKQIVLSAYNRGLRAGILITLIISTIVFLMAGHEMQKRLTDEARATTYYYNLTQNK